MIFFHFSKNEKVKKNAKKCIKEAEIEKKLSALFFLKFDLESTVEDQNFKKINNEASRAKTIFSRKKIAKLCILTRGGGEIFFICIPKGSTTLPTHAGFFRVSKFEF